MGYLVTLCVLLAGGCVTWWLWACCLPTPHPRIVQVDILAKALSSEELHEISG